MAVFSNKIIVILSQLLLFVADFANLFLSDIIIYETTTGLSFDFKALTHNKWFWILLTCQIFHILIVALVSAINRKNDEKVEKAISDQQLILISMVSKQSNYSDVEELLKSYDELEKRRNKSLWFTIIKLIKQLLHI